MNEADTLKQEYFELRNHGADILRRLQDGITVDGCTIATWHQFAEVFVKKFDMVPDSVKAEICPDADRDFKGQIFSLGELIDKAIGLRDSSKSNELNGRRADFVVVDEIIAERGEIHGDANNSGAAFNIGVTLLAEVSEKSNIDRHEAFDGHMYMAMFKMLRLMHNPYHKDNYDDLLGYLKLSMTALEDKS